MDNQLNIRLGGVEDTHLSEGRITCAQLARASTVRARAGGQRLRTDPALFVGYVGEGDSAKAVAKELRLEYVQVTWKDEDPGAAALVERGVR
jgi:hypothetical protein